MKIKVSIEEALWEGNFDRFCEITGINPYCVAEGTATGRETYELTIDEAKECGLLKEKHGLKWFGNAAPLTGSNGV